MSCLRHIFFIIFILPVNSSLAANEPVSDVRVIIDVSGSMKKNDPKNLRAPALRMLVGLMPENTESGVWTFGKYVNMQVAHGKVTKSWKKQAMSESNKIHSRGLFTNIEEALKRTSQGWETANRKEQRHLVLLTDGMVDVSTNAELNDRSRKKILHEIVPLLKKSGVTIHTIALSKNADKKLMSAISGMTDGWHEAVANAEDLQRVFLRIFEKSTNVDSVPLENNSFTIDNSIEDMTVLVFRKPGESVTTLVTPANKTWSYKNHPKNISWHQDTGYDLISGKKPEVGKWHINAAVDPDNRVMVVTNLKLATGNFPNNIMYGDKLSLTAKLIQEGKTVTQERLLSLVKFNVFKQVMDEQISDTAKQATHGNLKTIQSQTPMLDDGNATDRLAKDGVYSVAFNTDQTSGDVLLTIQAKSPAFEREVRHTLKVHDTPADLNVTRLPNGNFDLQVSPRMELLIPHTVSIQVALPDGNKQTLQQTDDEKWHAEIDKQFEEQRVTVTLVGTRVNDKLFHVDFDKVLEVSSDSDQHLTLDTQATQAPVAPPAVASTTQDHQAPPVVPPPMPVPDDLIDKNNEKDAVHPENNDKQEAVTSEEAEENKDEGFSWFSTMMIAIYTNLILLLLAGLGFLIWKKRKAKLEKEQEELAI